MPHAIFQVVLVEAGGNDFRGGSAPPTWQAAYKAFLSQARDLNELLAACMVLSPGKHQSVPCQAMPLYWVVFELVA